MLTRCNFYMHERKEYNKRIGDSTFKHFVKSFLCYYLHLVTNHHSEKKHITLDDDELI